MGTSFSKVKVLLNEAGFNGADITKRFEKFIESDADVGWLMNRIFDIIEDGSFTVVPPENIRALAILADRYLVYCWLNVEYVDDIGKLLEYAYSERYYTETPNGKRIATSGEIQQGVRGLVVERTPRIPEDHIRSLRLFHWAYTGNPYHYIRCGYTAKYNYKERQYKEAAYSLIHRAADGIQAMIDLLRDDCTAIEKDIAILKKGKREKAYIYPSYAPDEMSEEMGVTTLFCTAKKVISDCIDDPEYTLAMRALYKKKGVTPEEIAILRRVYSRSLSAKPSTGWGEGQSKLEESTASFERKQLKFECDTLKSARNSGKIYPSHFVFKIISTLEKYGYERCSEKQHKVIEDALEIINKDTTKKPEPNTKEKKEPEVKIVSEFDIDDALNDIDTLFS